MSAELVPARIGRVRFFWQKSLWLYAMLVPGACFGLGALSRGRVLAGLGLAFVTLCLGHSVGLHRGVIHGSYRTSRAFRKLLVYGFVHAGLGGPLSWVDLHYQRDYWQNSDRVPRYFGYEQGVLRDYFWNLHLGFAPANAGRYRVPREISQDPWLRWLERSWRLHVLAGFALLWLACGWQTAACLGPLRVSASILGHWLVGFVAHTHGSQRYAVPGAQQHGRNTLVLGWLSFGEGFHNNHHQHPNSARMGERWYELDLGWLAIRACERLGLIWDVRRSDRVGFVVERTIGERALPEQRRNRSI